MVRRATLIIQQHYRAHISSKKQQQEYIVLYNSIVLFQATWRGTIVRRQIKRQHQAAVTIQSYYRMHVNQAKFKHFIEAAVTIQRWYHAVIQARNTRQKYLALKEATVKMQAIYRGLRERRKIQRLNQAAICIQAMFKMHQCNFQYRTLKRSATIIQARYRAFCRGQKDRKKYLALRKSSLILQAAYRGMKIRQELRSRHQCILVIQSYYRTYRVRKAYLKLIVATKVIQQWYRATRDTNAQMYKYKMMKISALQIQAAFRGMKTRVLLKKMHMAAIIIQRNFKAFIQRREFIFLKSAAVTIQRRYRATILSKQQREKFLNLRRATIVIQQHYRRYRRTKQIRYLYLKQRQSALILQAAYRGIKVRHMLKKKHEAAVIIQSNYRKHRQWKSYKNIQWAVRLVQARVRAKQEGKVAVQQYCSIKKATVCIQKAFRKMKARNQRRQEAAVLLQRNFKMQRARKNYLALKAAAISLQRRYRATVLSKRQREKFLNLCRAVIVIQSTIRGLLARRYVKQMHQAAAVIQATFRMHITYTRYRTMKSACVVIQHHYRAYQTAKQTRDLYLKQRHSALILQAAYRGMKVRHMLKKKHGAAVVIQSNYRKHRQWKSYKNIQWAVRLVQARVRANQESKVAVQQYCSIKKATVCIQKAFRRMKARNQRRQEAAILLQRNFKMQRARKNYLALKAAAISFQRKYRALVVMRKQIKEYASVRTKIICVQSFYRGFKIRKEVKHQHLAATVIQATFRMYKVKLAYQKLRYATITMQKYYRSHLKEKHQNTHQAVQKSIRSQVTCRETKIQPELDIMHISATITQSLYWMNVQQKHYKLIWWAVITIQSAYRGMIARKKTNKMRAARNRQLCHIAVNDRTKAIESKSECHTNKTREQYQKYWKAAVLIQQHYRSYLTMKHHSTVYLQTRKRIILLQATVRGFIERQRFSRMKRSTIKIQRWYRGNWQRRKYLQYRKKIIIIQRMVRRWISHRNINTGGISKDINPKNVNTGVIKFQALWRGYAWRKKTDTSETRSLRDSLIIANKESKEEKKLYNRTAVAIDYLLKYKHFSYILAALKDLEVVTRLSPVCCENMAQSKAVCTIFTLIRSCNRSVPSMDVIKYSVQVLLNLSKYERTTDAVYSVENSVETLLDLLQMYRERPGDKTSEKSGSIFTKTCCLFAHLSKDSRRASEIRNNHKTVASLRRLFRLTARKHQMDVQRMLAKQKKVAYINRQSSIRVKTKIVSRQRPDWDLRKDNIREIVDPLQAIEMVVNTLGITCN